MFLLASLCHVGAHPGEHQHGVSIQISISLGKTFLQISRLQNIPLTWILVRVFVLCTSFHFPDSGLYLLNGFDFYFGLFWMVWHLKPALLHITRVFPCMKLFDHYQNVLATGDIGVKFIKISFCQLQFAGKKRKKHRSTGVKPS